MRARSIVLLLSSMSALAACGEDPGPEAGVLVVPFTLGNNKTCEDLGVALIRGELDDGMYAQEADCDAGKIRFDLLMPGTYEISAFGLDAEGYEVVDSLEDGLPIATVVGEGTTVVADPALQLTATPARLMLRWEFGFASCDGAGIDRFEVSAWRSDGSQLLLETALPCGMAGDGPGQYRTVPDLERRLSGDEIGEVSVQPVDDHGLALGEPVDFVFESPGAGRYVRLSVSCDEGGCEGSGEPD